MSYNKVCINQKKIIIIGNRLKIKRKIIIYHKIKVKKIIIKKKK